MGNQLLKSYEVDEESKCDGGRYIGWSILQACHSERRESFTIFFFEKKLLERVQKRDKEAFFDMLRADASNLQKLRHPNILPIVDPLLEDKSSMAFVTRPTTMTLSGLLKTTGIKPSALEVQSGMLDICEALQFLHEDAKIAHLSLSPSCIFISPSGRWSLGGMGHSKQISSGNMTNCNFSFHGIGCISTNGREYSLNPPLQYAAPEMVFNTAGGSGRGVDRRCGFSSDVFSLGLIMYEAISSAKQPLLDLRRDDTSNYQSQCQVQLPLKNGLIPSEMHLAVSTMLSIDPLKRPSISQVLASSFFQNINIKALRFIECLYEKDEGQKIQFLRGLLNLLKTQSPMREPRILKYKVLFPLLNLVKESKLGPCLLPNVFFAIRKGSIVASQFQNEVWPKFRPLLTAKEIQIETVLIVINGIQLLLSLTNEKIVQEDIVPFVLKCLQLQEENIQDALLRQMPSLAKKLDYMVLRSSVCPRLLSIIVETGSSVVRVHGIDAVVEICASFDRSTVTDQIIPVLEKVVKMDRAANVCSSTRMAADVLSQRLGPKVTAEKLIPLLTQILAADSLPQAEFQSVMQTVFSLLKRVEDARSKEFTVKSANTAAVEEALGVSTDTDMCSLETLLMGAPPPPSITTTVAENPSSSTATPSLHSRLETSKRTSITDTKNLLDPIISTLEFPITTAPLLHPQLSKPFDGGLNLSKSFSITPDLLSSSSLSVGNILDFTTEPVRSAPTGCQNDFSGAFSTGSPKIEDPFASIFLPSATSHTNGTSAGGGFYDPTIHSSRQHPNFIYSQSANNETLNLYNNSLSSLQHPNPRTRQTPNAAFPVFNYNQQLDSASTTQNQETEKFGDLKDLHAFF